MKIPFWLIVVVLFGLFILKLTDGLSDDAKGVLAGITFGVLALSPLVFILIILADGRRRDRQYDDGYEKPQAYPQVPPVIVYNHLPAPQVHNHFPEPRLYEGASRYIVDTQREQTSYGEDW